MTFMANPSKRRARRAWPIHGYVGPNGGGKSAAMVWDTMPTLLSGRRVLSTVRLLDFGNPRPCEGYETLGGVEVECSICSAVSDPTGEVYAHRQAHPLYERLSDWKQLIEAEKCDVLLDEVTGVASSRQSQSLPAPVANKLVQLRRADVVVRWSAPAWARADLIIRECSQAVTYCTGYWSKVVEDEDGERLWAQKRLAKWRTFDAALFEDFTSGKREQLSALQGQWVRLGATGAFDAYDTYDAVAVVGTVTDTGRCYQCGGARPNVKCSCPHEPDSGSGAVVPVGARPEAAPEGAPAPGRRRLDVVNTG
jgi:hypothetical protein